MASTLLILGACVAQAPPATPTPAPSASPQRVEVTLSDALRIEPAAITVRHSEPVTFVITNEGSTVHEFFLGDEAAQVEHEAEMAMGEPMHDHSNGIAVEPGQTRELTFTFTPGDWLAGCHYPGHYPSGMRATISFSN